jgi:phenylpropionate dioxygenase-like ring-hydroxylating dioxygenase large terminal subunit
MDLYNGARMRDKYPQLGDEPVPVEPYISPAFFEKELKSIFHDAWLNVGRTDYIPRPGDYFVKELPILGGSILVVRGEDGRVRAFRNACQHRGNKLVRNTCGNRKNFSCGFHGWVFDTMGRLRYVPDEEQFSSFEKKHYGLPEITCDLWNGFIFLHARHSPKQSLGDFLGPIGQDLDEYPFSGLERVGSWHVTVKCNWKVLIDAFQESYHVVAVHSRSLADAFNNPGRANSLACNARLYDTHRGLSLPANPDYRPKPAEALAYKAAGTVMQGANTLAAGLKGVNHGKMENWGFDANVIFPNTVISAAHGWCLVQTYWPEAVDRTYWEINLHMPRARTLAERVAQSYNAALIRDVLMMEDATTIEATYSMVKMGALKHFMFSDQEIACRHQYEVVRRIVEGGNS